MTVNYTTLLRLVQPVTGTESGTWGDYVNNALTAYLDVAVAGTQTLSTDANATLTLTDGTNSGTNLGSTSAQYAIINMTGARTQTRTVTLPTSSRNYVVLNNTTGGYAMTVGGVSVAAGERCVLTYDTSATAYVKTASSISNLASVTGTLGVANGGTGATTLTANNVLLGNGTSAPLTVAPGTSGYVLASNGTTWASTSLPSATGTRADVFTTGTSATWTIPAGVTAVKVTIIGGGGGGGGFNTGVCCAALTGAGGGGGGVAIQYFTGVSGSMTYTVGAGGARGTTSNGSTGGTSSVTYGGTTYSATGGSGGTSDYNPSPGTGGTGSSATINLSGGKGFAPLSGSPAYELRRGGGTILGMGGGANGYGTGGYGAADV